MEQTILVIIGIVAVTFIAYKMKKSVKEGSCSGCSCQGDCSTKSE